MSQYTDEIQVLEEAYELIKSMKNQNNKTLSCAMALFDMISNRKDKKE